MKLEVLIDTGVLVAAIDRRDQFHQWATTELALLQAPLLTCEAVCTEHFFYYNEFMVEKRQSLRC